MSLLKPNKLIAAGRPRRTCERLCLSVLSVVLLLITVPVASSRTVTEAQFDHLYEAALAAIHKSDIKKSLRLGEESLLVARGMADRFKEAKSLELIGNAYFYLGRYADALNSFQAGLLIMRDVGDQQSVATVLKDIGITYNRLGRFDEGFGPLNEALNISRQLNDSAAVESALENLGMGYASLGAYNPAFEMCEQALEVAQQTKDPQLIFGALIRIGILYHSLNSGERALDYLKQALYIAEQQKLSPMDQAWAMQELSIALVMTGQTDAAIEMRQRSITICRQIGWKMGLADNYQGLGELCLDRNPALALRYFERAGAIYEGINYNLRSHTYASKAAAYWRLGNLDSAIESYGQAIERLESLRGQLLLEQHRATMLGKNHGMYQELLEALLERHERNPENSDAIRAFEIYEQGKARALLEAIAEARLDLERELDPNLRHKQQELGARLAELQNWPTASSGAKSDGRTMQDLVSQAEQNFDQFMVEIKKDNPRYATLINPRPLTLEQAQGLLDAQTAMLAYAITKNHVIGFLLTSKSFEARRLSVSPRVLTARVQTYVDLIARGDQSGWQNASARLYAELVDPLRADLPREIKHLIIVPDGVLHYLPFETLRSVENSGPSINDAGLDQRPHFLLQDFSISYAPSATVLAELNAIAHSRIATERADLLIIAEPVIGKGSPSQFGQRSTADLARALYDDEGMDLTPIPFSGAEAQKVEQYAGPGSRVYTGREASEHHIKTGKLDNFRVIHFATHALISQRKPERSALILASPEGDGEDGFLQAREIYRLKLASDLLVLSACETARGRILAGEGTQGLAHAFFYAGAQSVVASLWKVNDEETATFMGAFYQHLAQRKSKAEALRAAKLDMMRDESASPRHWASFILIGEAVSSVPITDRSWRLRYDRLPLVSTVAVLIALIAFVAFRRRAA
jgi:CHAT domain-containing protein